ncbi:unnamed protein product [Heterobilharzia americana]|nr:unnamed protein product [Heterobilharzia americana]
MHIAYVYSNQIGPFSEPAEVFRTHEDVPSRIPNVLVNSDGLDGLLVEWDAPEQPNGQILQYILHYNEVKPTDWLANNEPSDHQEFSFLKNTYRTQNKNDISASIQDYYLNSSQSIERHLYQMKHLSSSASRNSDLISSPHSQMYDNRKYAGYYSLNRTTYRIHIESLISHHVYQIRMFALNTAGLSPVTLQLGFTSSSISVTRGKENYPLSDKQFLQWVNLIHFGKHEQKIFKWLNGTSIGFIKVPDIVMVNGHDAEVSTELEITSENVYFLTNNKNQLFYSNESYRAANDLLQIIKLIEQSKWAVKIQEIPSNGYQTMNGDVQIDSWQWRIIMPHQYNLTSPPQLSTFKASDSQAMNRTQVTFLFKLFNLSSYTNYRIEIWQPIGLLFGTYEHIAETKVSHSEPSKWFSTGSSPPKAPPSVVYAQTMSSDEMKITWQPLSEQDWSGLPGGYLITIQEIKMNTNSLHLQPIPVMITCTMQMKQSIFKPFRATVD